MALNHNEYHNNDGGTNGLDGSMRRHPWLTAFGVLFIVGAIGGVVLKIVGVFLYLVLTLGFAFILALGAWWLISLIGRAIRGKDTTTDGRPDVKWKHTRDSAVPDDLARAAKSNDDAKALAAEYDRMMDVVRKSGGDVDIVAASYGEKIKHALDIIRIHEDMTLHPSDYPDVAGAEADYHKAIDSLIGQFRDTIRDINANETKDMRMHASAIVDNDDIDTKIPE